MATSFSNKKLYTDINRLKLLSKSDSQTRFILEQSPFSEDGEDEEVLPLRGNRDDPIIIGRIFPNSEIYNQGSYRIEIKLLRNYPMDPPAIRFLTRIYHPNVAPDGIVSNPSLDTHYSFVAPLCDLVRNVVECIDNPDIAHSVNSEVGAQYMHNKTVYDRTALEYVKRYALPRH